MNQQARNFLWQVEESHYPAHFLIRDRDAKYSSVFNALFETEGIKVIRTPIRAPKANAYAERWIRSVREECLDRLIIFNQRHLQDVLAEYINYYNRSRPHQGIEQQCPDEQAPCEHAGIVRCRDVFGGLIHDYYRQAA